MAAVDCALRHTTYSGTLPGTGGLVREFTLPASAWGATVDAAGANAADLLVSTSQSLEDGVSSLTTASDCVPVLTAGVRVIYLGPPTSSTRRKIFVASATASATVKVTPGGPELAQS